MEFDAWAVRSVRVVVHFINSNAQVAEQGMPDFDRQLVVIAAEDNLIRGASGVAVLAAGGLCHLAISRVGVAE
jgi:N-acetyl-gamma-glutamylphosphate reductase